MARTSPEKKNEFLKYNTQKSVSRKQNKDVASAIKKAVVQGQNGPGTSLSRCAANRAAYWL